MANSTSSPNIHDATTDEESDNDTLKCTLHETSDEEKQERIRMYLPPLDSSRELLASVVDDARNGFCRSHTSEACTLIYCRSCDLSLCHKCILSKSHLFHNLYNLEVIMDKLKLYYKPHEYDYQFYITRDCVSVTILGQLEPYLDEESLLTSFPRWKTGSLFVSPATISLNNSNKSEEDQARIATSAPTSPVLVFGGRDNKNRLLCRPWGIACTWMCHFVVADRSKHCIKIYDEKGEVIDEFGSMGSLAGEFKAPTGVAVDPADRIIVADQDNHRIQIFDAVGNFILMFGKFGNYSGQFDHPWDVACNKNSQIVVSDSYNHRVQLFDRKGTFLAKFGFEDNLAMHKVFDLPRGVCFGPSGDIIVTDFNNHCLIVFDPQLNYRTTLGSEGEAKGQFNRPQGIVCDDEGRVAVADYKNRRIQVFEHDGRFLWKVDLDMNVPSGIALSSDGKLAVIDGEGGKIHVYN